MNISRTLSLLFLVIYIPAGLAAEKDQILQLLDSGNAREAYSVALQRMDKEEGSPQFDFLFGLAAIESLHPDQALFPLERVLINNPDHLRARLELGRAYFMLGDYTASKRQFNLVLNKNPPENVKSRIKRFLDAIEQREKALRTNVTTTLEVVHGYDSNINTATSDTSVNIPALGGSVQLGSSSRETSENFREIKANMRVQHALSKKKGLYANVKLEDRNNFGSESLDTLTAGIKGGYTVLNDRDRYELSLQYDMLYLDGDRYRKLPALNGQWTRKFGKASTVMGFAQLGKLRYITVPIRDVGLSLAGAAWTFPTTLKNVQMSLTGFYGDERPKHASGNQHGRDYFGLRAGLQWERKKDQVVYGMLGMQEVGHDARDPVFNVTRDDSYKQILLGWAWQPKKPWMLKAEANFVDNKSNIALYDYSRHQVSFSVRYKFD